MDELQKQAMCYSFSVQVMTKRQQQYTQSGHALLCKQCAIVYSFWQWLAGQSLTEKQHQPKAGKKKRPVKQVFFSCPRFTLDVPSGSGLTELYPHRSIIQQNRSEETCVIHMALECRAHWVMVIIGWCSHMLCHAMVGMSKHINVYIICDHGCTLIRKARHGKARQFLGQLMVSNVYMWMNCKSEQCPNQEGTVVHAIWPCLAVQAMCYSLQYFLAMACWAMNKQGYEILLFPRLAGQSLTKEQHRPKRPVRKKSATKRVFFFWFLLCSRCFIKKWVNRTLPTQVDHPSKVN